MNEKDDLILEISGKEILFGKSTTLQYDEQRGFNHTIVIDTNDDKNKLVAEFYVNRMIRGKFTVQNLPRNKDTIFVEMNDSSSSSLQHNNNDLRVNLEMFVLYFDPATYEECNESKIPKEMLELVRFVRTAQRQKKIQMYERENHKLRNSLRGGRTGYAHFSSSQNISSELKTNQAASEAQIDYLKRLIEIHAKLVKMTTSPSGSGVVRPDVPKPPRQSMILRGDSSSGHVDIHRREDGDLDLDIGDVHIHMHSCSSPQFSPPPVPHENFDAEKWVTQFVTRLEDGLSSLNDDDRIEDTVQKRTPDSLPKHDSKVTQPPKSPKFESLPDSHLGTNENHKESPRTTARLLKRLRHRLESERASRHRDLAEFKAELDEKNAALKHFKKLCERQRQKIEEMSLRSKKQKKRFQETETELIRSSETEIETISRSNNMKHEEYGAFLEKMMESCSEATARAVCFSACVCVFAIVQKQTLFYNHT